MTDNLQEIDSLTMQRARKGEMQAFAAIYEAYGKRCYNLALRMSGSRAMAEDVVHDTFLKIMRRFRSYRAEASLWSWVRAITANTTINAMNQRKWWTSLDAITQSDTPSMPPPSQTDMSGEREHDISSILQTLAPQARTVLLLHDLEGMTHKEIADLFGQSESFSKSVLHRARKQLEGYLHHE